MSKYRVTFVLEAYDSSPGQFYAQALDHLSAVIEKHRAQLMWVALDRVKQLPNGGIEGTPHSDRLDGWLCSYTVEEGGS